MALAACGRSPEQRIFDAGIDTGRTQASVVLPAWPAWCKEAVPHAPLAIGGNVVSTLARERSALDFANTRAANCAANYDKIKAGVEAASPAAG